MLDRQSRRRLRRDPSRSRTRRQLPGRAHASARRADRAGRAVGDGLCYDGCVRETALISLARRSASIGTGRENGNMAPSLARDGVIEMCRRVALENGGRPPGSPAFYRSTGLSPLSLHDVGIRTYGDLCELAGYPKNKLRAQLTPDELLRPLAELTVRLGRFPNQTDREMARRADSLVPSYEAYRTAEAKKGYVPVQLLDWCSGRPEFSSAQAILRQFLLDNPLSTVAENVRSSSSDTSTSSGTRYAGRHFKVGMSEDVQRRNNQIDKMNPHQVRVEHVIETDDPRGIEKYWLSRFACRCLPDKNEIFALSPEDVAAFKRRKYQ